MVALSVQDSGLDSFPSTSMVTPSVSEVPFASAPSFSLALRPWQAPIPSPMIAQELPLIASIWNLLVFVAIFTTPLFELPATSALSPLQDNVSENYLKRINFTFYDTMKDCVYEVLKDGLISMEPIGDILASFYVSVIYMVGHEVAAPFEKYVKVFMHLASAWRSLHINPMTPLVDIFKERLMREFQQQREGLIQ